MSALLCLTFAIILHVAEVFGYYLSSSGFTWENAQLFCESRCNSELASIHSQNQQNELINLIMDDNISSYSTYLNKDVWVGLYNDSEFFMWSDNSTFDFGNNLTGSVTPWNNNQPSYIIDKSAVYLSCTDTVSCPWMNQLVDDSTKKLFLCNKCDWNVLTKYIVIDELKTNENVPISEANNMCNLQFRTSLATIHSNLDNNEARYLCQNGIDIDRGCHIGLYKVNDSNYKWTDNTTFEYGTNISSGVYPWDTYSPSPDASCSQIFQNSYMWRLESCQNYKPILCNKPSQLCFKDKWIELNSVWIFNTDCSVINDGIVVHEAKTMMDISDKGWKYIAIDYMFKYAKDTEPAGAVVALSGIRIVFNSIEDMQIQYFIGLCFDFVGNFYVFFRWGNADNDVIMTSSFWLNLDNYHLLSIQFNESNIFNIKLNHNDTYFTSQDLDISGDLPENYYIEQIGIQHYGPILTAKYLYMNGGDDNVPTLIPTEEPTTLQPTTSTTTTITTSTIATTNSQISTTFTTVSGTIITTKSTFTLSPTSTTNTQITDNVATTDVSSVSNQGEFHNNDSIDTITLIIIICVGGVVFIIIIVFVCWKYRNAKLVKNDVAQIQITTTVNIDQSQNNDKNNDKNVAINYGNQNEKNYVPIKVDSPVSNNMNNMDFNDDIIVDDMDKIYTRRASSSSDNDDDKIVFNDNKMLMQDQNNNIRKQTPNDDNDVKIENDVDNIQIENYKYDNVSVNTKTNDNDNDDDEIKIENYVDDTQLQIVDDGNDMHSTKNSTYATQTTQNGDDIEIEDDVDNIQIGDIQFSNHDNTYSTNRY